jgi:integrase
LKPSARTGRIIDAIRRNAHGYAITVLELNSNLAHRLRRSELTRLTVSHLQQRDGHWAIVDLFGKGGHVRTVPVPAWVKVAFDSWLAIAGIDTGIIFRCVSRSGHVWRNRLREKAVLWVVREYAKLAGIDDLAPYDLRRTCARLCHSAGGELEQIQFLLGHRSVETTERYLGSRQRLVGAVNDHLGIEPPDGSYVTFPASPEVLRPVCIATKRRNGDIRMAVAMQKLESAESD